MEKSLKAMALFLTYSTTITGVLGIHNVSIIITFPFKYIGGSINTRLSTEEILTGGYVAVNDINNECT